MTEKLLKLKAKDADDLQVISAVLQDSIAPVCDMMYKPESKSFVMVVHRLRREAANDAGLERVCCAINLYGVENVQMQGVDLNRQDQILDLLAVMPKDKSIQLVFAGEAKIRLQLGTEQSPQNDWSMMIEDFGDPWPASCSPCHDN